MASGQQLNEAIRHVLGLLSKQGIDVPPSIQNSSAISQIAKHANKKNSPEMQTFMNDLRNRKYEEPDQYASDKRDRSIAYDPADKRIEDSRPEIQVDDYARNEPLRGVDAPVDHQLPHPGFAKDKKGMQQDNIKKIYNDPYEVVERPVEGHSDLDNLYNEIQYRQPPARKTDESMVRNGRRSAPDTEKRQVAYRQGDARKAERVGDDPYKVGRADALSTDSHRAYSDDVPTIESASGFDETTDDISDMRRLISDINSGKIASGKTGLMDAKAKLIEALATRKDIGNIAQKSGKRFSDLNESRGGTLDTQREPEMVSLTNKFDRSDLNVRDPSANPEQLTALREYINSMRNN